MPFYTGRLISNITLVSATSAATNFPAANLLSFDPIARPWRSTSRVEQDLIFNLGNTYGTVLTNEAFATDLSGWVNSDVGAITWDGADVPAGFTGCVVITDASAATGYSFYQYYTAGQDLGGSVATLTFAAKKHSGSDMTVRVQFLDARNTILGTSLSQAITAGIWTSYAISGVIPSGTLRVQVIFTSAVGTVGVARATNFRLRLGVMSVALFGANFGSVEIATDIVSGLVSPTALAGSPFSLAPDRWDGQWKYCTVQTTDEQYVRLRIIAGQPTRGNVDYYQLGAVAFSDRMLPFTTGIPHGGQPLIGARRTVEKPLYTINAGGREEVAAAGPFGVTDEWEGRFSLGLIDEWRDLGLMGPETPFLVFDNLGNPAEVYLMRYRDSISWTRNNSHFDSNLRLQQII